MGGVRALLCVAFNLLALGATLAQEPPRPLNRAAWITRLQTLQNPLTRDDYLSLNQFQALDGKTSYEIMCEAWSGMASEEAKMHLVTYAAYEPRNPRLFKILHLARTDSSLALKSLALRRLRYLLLLDLSDDAAYRAWRHECEDLPVDEVVKKSALLYVAQLRNTNDAGRIRLLGALLEFPFLPFRETSETKIAVGRTGIMELRHNAVIEGGIIPALFDLLAPSLSRPVQAKALACIAHLGLGAVTLRKQEAQIRPVAGELIENSDATFVEKFALLASFSSDWAIDPLLKLATEGLGERNFDKIVEGLVTTGNRRAAPFLIALMDYPDLMPPSVSNSVIPAQLSRLCDAPGGDWTASQWREWWYNNREGYDKGYVKQPFPRLEVLTQKERTLYRKVRLPVYLSNETKPAYQFISSGLMLDKGRRKPAPLSPGLIVALESSEQSPITAAGRWQETLEEAVFGGYVIALVSEPKLRPERVRKIVQDVLQHIPIDPKRVFLHGSGALGKVAYSCSLEPNSPFKGYWMKNSPFSLAGLPPLKFAKNRNYYVQNETNGVAPYLQSMVAQSKLEGAGAKVHLERTDAALTAAQLRIALAWLEGANR